MFEQLTASTRAAVITARVEARRQGSRAIGTEHLLLGVLTHDEGRLASALGADAAACRAALVRMDAEALASVGVDVAAFGTLREAEAESGGHLPLTAASKKALSGTLREARRAKRRSLQPEDLLLALLARERPDPVAELLTRMSVDPELVRHRLSSAA
jgi:ATP-dependent Clp protease ATP-binding subunit ClpA